MDEVTHESASVKVSVSRALPVHMREVTREVHGMYVPPEDRRKGYAAALMQEVCRQADLVSLTLMLFVEPYLDFDMSKSQLEAWYARFGFITIQEQPCLMARMPHSTPRVLQ